MFQFQLKLPTHKLRSVEQAGSVLLVIPAFIHRCVGGCLWAVSSLSKTHVCSHGVQGNTEVFVVFLTLPLHLTGWYPWRFLQCLQKEWPVTDVWYVFPCVSSGLLRPASENNSQGHVDLPQMSGPGTGGGGPRKRRTMPWKFLSLPFWGIGFSSLFMVIVP